jgi:hypothetical protein
MKTIWLALAGVTIVVARGALASGGIKGGRKRGSAAVRKLPAVALFLIGSGAVTLAQGQTLRTTGTEVFCRNKTDFPEYLAVANNKQSKDRTVPGCMEPKKGIRYKVLEEHPENGLDKIRLFVGGRGIDGYVIGRGE